MFPNKNQADPMDALAQALMPYLTGQKKLTDGLGLKAATGTPVGPYVHGPGGLFGVSGLERDVFSTRIAPRGLAGRLPVVKSDRMNPLFAYITGYLDTTGANATTPCATPPTAGAMKNCLQTAQFGRYSYQTRELEVNRVGQVNDRGEFIDLQVVNDPLAVDIGAGIFPQLPEQSQILAGREMLARMLEVGVAFQNKLVRQTYAGNPTNNNSGGGYKEFPGLDILIGTAKEDALTRLACPSLASDIKNFNYGNVATVSGNADIVHVISNLWRYVSGNADRMNFGATTFAFSMRLDLFYELTAIWPCSYLTYRCTFRTTDGTIVQNVSATDQIAMRDAMRAGKYLLIEGTQVEVIIDDGIIEHNRSGNANIPIGGYASDIYLVPLTVRGGIPATYWEVFDYGAALQAAQDAHYAQEFWTDDGRYLWAKEPNTRWCTLLSAKIEPRIILRTPQLAGRVLNVSYVPLQHQRDALPTDYYFVNGGVSTARAAPSYYSDWNL